MTVPVKRDLVVMSKELHALRKDIAAKKQALSDLNTAKDKLETELIEAMAEAEVNSVSIDGLGLFSMTTTNYLSVNAANKVRFYSYLKESGHGGLLKEEVNSATLTAFLKGHLIEVTKKFVESDDLEEFDARKKALEYLNGKGASYFSERGVSVRSKA